MKNITHKNSNSHELFEAISHPLRIKVLKSLSRTPMSFSELKRVVNVESSGALDFHLRKMQSLIATDSTGRYTLSTEGYVALEAIRTIEQYGWQRRAYLLNLCVYIISNLWALITFSLSSNFFIVFTLSTLWILSYSYWTLIHRRIPLK